MYRFTFILTLSAKNQRGQDVMHEGYECSSASAGKAKATRLCRQYILENLTDQPFTFDPWSSVKTQKSSYFLTGRTAHYTDEDGVPYSVGITLQGEQIDDNDE